MNLLTPELLAVIYGLLSSTCWGAGDFSGGFATKRSPVYAVILVSQLFGTSLLILMAFLFSETIPSLNSLVFGGIAGICNIFGLVALYRGLANGRMGIVAPVAAVIAALLPVLVSFLSEGIPAIQKIIGFGAAFLAVWLLTRSGGSHEPIRLRELKLPIFAGIVFSVFFTLIGRASREAVFWPLIVAKIASIIVLIVFAGWRRHCIAPAKNQIMLLGFIGIIDAIGSLFFALAAQVGRLDIATVLSSLYPAVTVLLAWIILKERLSRQQWAGVIAALMALSLIAL